jgi:hypothetical protein
MLKQIIVFASVVLATLALIPAMAHVFEMRDDYRTVQQIYRGWSLLGFVVVAAQRLKGSAGQTFGMPADSADFRNYYFSNVGGRGTATPNTFGGFAMALDAAFHRFEYDGWHVVIEFDGVALDGVSSGHADLQRSGEPKRRITLAGKYRNAGSALASLSEKARAFVDEWDIKREEGESPFFVP